MRIYHGIYYTKIVTKITTFMKTQSHQYKTGRRIVSPYTFIFSVAIFCIWLVSNQGYDNTYVSDHINHDAVVVTEKKEVTVEDKIREYFPKNWKTMVAVAHAESQMNQKAVGYNCYYADGIATSTAIKGGSRSCDVKDRSLAWSRDCGLLQINTTKKSCPKETLDEHLKRAADLSRSQGLGAWVTYNENLHAKYLTNK